MDYHYETLNHQRFQKFCQAVIVAEFPKAQCLPVDQPDGGRDAFFFDTVFNRKLFTVFQVKFSKNPFSKKARETIKDAIQSEKEKVEKLIQRGATKYVLITNFKGTAHLDVGSIDKVNQTLSKEFSISSQVWWRDDLDRRLENFPDIKWNYPEILKATDILPLLVRSHSNSGIDKVVRALTSYMAMQYEKDKDVKFKQVDLKRNLTNLFVDLPIGHKQPETGQRGVHHINFDELDEISAYLNLIDIEVVCEFQQMFLFGHSGLAAEFLANMPPDTGVSRFVIEGSPGQGKSTLTQFLCQVNRMRFLDEKDELDEKIDDAHKHGIARTPFRIDMRDYAVWASKRDPFSKSDETSRPADSLTSLESFLVRHVEALTGGLQITLDELLRFFTVSHSIIVLDGFDEVADLNTRERIVEEICEAAKRLDQHAKSMQIIVTSRPVAFANSPGFPEDDWIHLELKDLQNENIEAYKNKWIKVKNLDEEDSIQVSSTLESKLEQSSLFDLARNPMQLTILLHLIHVHGMALPEKRTLLYKEYMNLFFNREAEKSKVVQKHRELLLSIHGVLAWILHTQVENGVGSGSITKDEFIEEVRIYLETEEYDSISVQELFQGTVERVGALVSRKEGMYEFEVQPLREYFAARHLYMTAPYSPAGNDKMGTKPDRFDALARNFFWTNVTRFYCGFYDQGELASLVDGIICLSESDGYSLINHPRNLAMMLLSDHVFTQAPRAMKRLVRFVTEEPGFQRFTSMESPQHSRRKFGLSSDVGGEFLFEVCMERLNAEDDPTRQRGLRWVMAENADRDELKSIWMSEFCNGLRTSDLLDEAIEFGIINCFEPEEIAALASHDVDFHLRWLMLQGSYEAIEDDPTLQLAAKKAFFDDELHLPLRRLNINPSSTALELLTETLQPGAFAQILRSNANSMALNIMPRRVNFDGLSKISEKSNLAVETNVTDTLNSFGLFLIDMLRKDVNEWQTDLECWSKLVDRGLEEAPGSYKMVQFAIISTATRANISAGTWDENGFAATKGLVKRLFFARHKSDDVNWWQEILSDINPESLYLCLSVLLSWGESRTIASLMPRMESLVDRLAPDQWSRLWELTRYVLQAAPGCGATFSVDWFPNFGILSPRMALIMIKKVLEQEFISKVTRTYLINYAGDDSEMLLEAVNSELHGFSKEPINWDHVKNLSKRMRELGNREIKSIPLLTPFRIPQNVAKDVLANSELHHGEFVAACETRYATAVAQEASKLSELDWFTPLS